MYITVRHTSFYNHATPTVHDSKAYIIHSSREKEED